MNRLTHYLAEFNRDHLRAPADRRRTLWEVLRFAASIAIMLLTYFLLVWMEG